MDDGYSPYQEAGAAFESMGRQLNATTLGLAQLRARQEQQAFQNALTMAYRRQQMQHLAQEDAYQRARIGQLNEQGGYEKARMSHQALVDKSAQEYGDMVTDRYMPPSQSYPLVDEGQEIVPGPLNMMKIDQQDPRKVALARELGRRAMVAALAGNPQHGDIGIHNIPLNAVGYDSTGQYIPGPMGGPAGYRVQMPGVKDAMDVPQTANVPPGYTPATRMGEDVNVQGQQTPFRPGTQRQGMYSYHPAGGYVGSSAYVLDHNTGTMYPLVEPQGTNNSTPAHFGAPLNVPGYEPRTNSGNDTVIQRPTRVKVISPNGQKGTIPFEQLEEAKRNGYKQVVE